MAIEPAPLPHDDEALRTRGVIAVQSARVEWQLAGLRSVVDASASHAEHLRQGKAREHAKVVKAFLEQNVSWAGPIATAECKQSAAEADQALFERGNLLHSGWVTTSGEAETDSVLTRRNLKSGTELPFNQAELDEPAQRLGVLAATGYIMMLIAEVNLFTADD